MRSGSCSVSASYISSWSATLGGAVGDAVLPRIVGRSSVVTFPREPGGRMFHRLP
jgi:hypothetical protein